MKYKTAMGIQMIETIVAELMIILRITSTAMIGKNIRPMNPSIFQRNKNISTSIKNVIDYLSIANELGILR